MTIPSKYLVTDEHNIPEGALGLKCSKCGAMFAIPPQDITSDLAAATVCEGCAAAEEAAAVQAAKPDLDHTSTL